LLNRNTVIFTILSPLGGMIIWRDHHSALASTVGDITAICGHYPERFLKRSDSQIISEKYSGNIPFIRCERAQNPHRRGQLMDVHYAKICD
jgi:hypothetical protein